MASVSVRASIINFCGIDNQEALFNPNCKTLVLIDNIKKRCKCRIEAVIDLSDEKGEIKHLQEHKVEYANSLLKERETLILLEIEKNEDQEIKYTPLLNNVNKLYPEIKGRLDSNRSSDSQLDACNNSSRQSTRSVKQKQTHQNASKGASTTKHKKQQHDTHAHKKGHNKPHH